MKHDVTFEEVLAAAKANSGWAFTRLYEGLVRAVRGYLRVQGATDPDDLVSEVFLAAFSRVQSFEGTEAQFRSWVFTIAHHRMVDERRARTRRPQTEPLDTAVRGRVQPGHVSSAEHDALHHLAHEDIQRLLERLTPDQRDVLSLRVVSDLSVEQVAEALGKQPGTVRVLQHRALAALRRELADDAVTL